MKTVPEIMREAIRTYEERNAVYGDSYTRFGHLMTLLFPKGLKAETPEELNRLGLLVQIITKLVRFTNSGLTHRDSIHDIGVYSFMMEEILPPQPPLIILNPRHPNQWEEV